MKTAIILSLLCVLVGVSQAIYSTGAGCSSSVSTAKRDSDGMWQDELGRINAVYELTVTNTGACPSRYIGVNIALPEGFSAVQSWNLNFEPRFTMVTGFGRWLAPGATYNSAGLAAAKNVTTKGEPSVTVYGTACDEDCIVAQEGSSSESSAPSGSAGDSSCVEDSSAPSGDSSDSTTDVCKVTVGVSRDGNVAAWTDSKGRTVRVFNLNVTNEGTCVANYVQLAFYVDTDSEIISTWNVENGILANYGGSIASGTSFLGAGLTVAGSVDVAVTNTSCGGVCSPKVPDEPVNPTGL